MSSIHTGLTRSNNIHSTTGDMGQLKSLITTNARKIIYINLYDVIIQTEI